MDSTSRNVQLLKEAEIKLNKIRFNNIGLGSVLSTHLDSLYRDDFDNRPFHHLVYLGYLIFNSLFKIKKIEDWNKEIIYYKTGHHKHLEAMLSAIHYNKDIKEKTLSIGPSSTSVPLKKVYNSFSLIDVFKVNIFVTKKFKEISKILSILDISLKRRGILFLILSIQLIKAKALIVFFSKQKSLKVVGADYDRGKDTCLMFAAAKALNIKNFTLQHGVHNPPVGYAPVNADEIWVWNKMTKLQLTALGEDEHKIRITGTPIISDIRVTQDLRLKYLEKYNLKKGKVIVLALSHPDKANDYKMVKYIADLKRELGTRNYSYVVKIHPAREFSLFSWIEEEFNIRILPHDIPFKDTMNITDILLTHTSGLATEALYYNKKVGVLDILKSSPGNGLELHKYFNVPLLKSTEDFKVLLTTKNDSVSKNDIYFKTGVSAQEEITLCLKRLLNSAT